MRAIQQLGERGRAHRRGAAALALLHWQVVDLATVLDVDGLDPRAVIGALDLDLDELARLRQLGKWVVLADAEPLTCDLQAGLLAVYRLDQARDTLEVFGGHQAGLAVDAAVPSGQVDDIPWKRGVPLWLGLRLWSSTCSRTAS